MKSNTITVLSSAAMNGSTITSEPIPVDQVWGYAVQASWTGTPSGTLSLQASSQSPPNQSQVSNGGPDNITIWDTITGSDTVVSGSPGTFMWNVTTASYRYFRLVYAGASGTGTLNAVVCLKGI